MFSMSMYNKVRPWIGRKSVRGALVVAILALVLVGIYVSGRGQAETEIESLPPVVSITTAQQYAGQSIINLIGTVRAFSEAAVTAERAGRVTSVRVGLGDTVTAGQIIATLENASEQAAVLQAEGSYEAALAASAQSSVGTAEANTRIRTAQNSAITNVKTAFTTVEGIVVNNIDQFFSSPDTSVPGLKIDGSGNTAVLNSTRVQFQSLLPEWQSRVNTVSPDSDIDTEIAYALAQVQRTLIFVDTFISTFNNQGRNGRYTETELQSFGTTFNGLRNSLIQTQALLDSTQTELANARDALARAELAASGGTTSAADAQVKQALGSLRAAQATLAKTIIRTPITGTVNILSVRTGDFIGAQSQIAEVANNNALEVVTFVGENDRNLISVGEEVLIENAFKGIITEIAPAVDAATGKTEVRIASESDTLQNGDSVNLVRTVAADSVQSDRVVVPLSAIKFQITDGLLFVIENNVLVTRPVTLGTIRGGSVEITEGLTADEAFVIDARGLVEGTVVEAVTK